MAFSSTSNARQIRNRRIAADRQNLVRYGGNNSPPPLSQSPSSCTSSSSPPTSPIPACALSTMSLPTHPSDKSSSRQLHLSYSSPQNPSPTSCSNRSRPPIVSHAMPHSPSKSWDEGDDHPTKLRARLSFNPHTPSRHAPIPIPLTHVHSDLTGTSSLRPRYNLNPRMRGSSMQLTSICPDGNVFDDPCLYDGEVRSHESETILDPSKKFVKNNFNELRSSTPTNTTATGFTASTLRSEDDISSLGDVEDCTISSGASLRKLTYAIKTNAIRPSNMTTEENLLWDAVQAAKRQAHLDALSSYAPNNVSNEILSSAHNNEHVAESHTFVEPTSPSDDVDNSLSLPTSLWESRCQDAKELAMKQQKDNARSLRAIQRVLADVQAQRDKAIEELLDLRQNSSGHLFGNASEDIDSVADHQQKEEHDTLKHDLNTAHNRISQLEKEMREERLINEALRSQCSIMTEREQNQGFDQHGSIPATNSKDAQDTSVTKPNSGEATERLRKELAEKTTALENAKMIITSLESASNIVAGDLRSKLKAKEEECNKLKRDSEERQKTLDTLATELRDLQCSKNKTVGCSEIESSRRFALTSRLEKIITEVRAATVVLEATQDPAAVQSLGEILEDSVNVLKDGITIIEDYADDGSTDIDSVDSGNNDNSRYGRSNNDSWRLKKELDEKKKKIRRLEENLRKSKDELKRLHGQIDDLRRSRDDEVQSLHTEIKILRQQCNTNMEVLTKKERELAVLRDSLQVEDLNVGYISDDNSEGDEEEEVNPIPSLSLARIDYGPSQAEALATLLAQGGNRSFDAGSSGPSRSQIEGLRNELARVHAEKEKLTRELKVEKESLSNAKMIISSLERANKSMMEDLRSRLQDSNSAIASLLEKSLESEKTSSRLRAELADALQRERERSFEENITSNALMVLPVETID